MKLTKTFAALAILGLLTGCGEGTSSTGSTSDERKSTTPGTVPATETDSDPTPQTGTGGSGQSRPSGQNTP